MSKSLFENSDLCLVGSNSKDKNPTINQVKEDSELKKTCIFSIRRERQL